MIAVVDTSALIRLFIPDGEVPAGLEAFFRGAESGLHRVIAPELLAAEAANVVLKKRRLGVLSDVEGEELLKDLMALPVRLFPHRHILKAAYDLAHRFDLTVYDGLFLALAMDRAAILFTADDALAQASRGLGTPTNIEQPVE